MARARNALMSAGLAPCRVERRRADDELREVAEPTTLQHGNV
jgi:hypothetical protein